MSTPVNPTNTPSEQDRRRMESDREEPAERTARARPRDGSAETRPGLLDATLRLVRPATRDHKRHFREPPMRDVERLRELATA